MYNRFQVQFLRGHQGKPLREIEAHLMAEHRERAGAGAVTFSRALGAHPVDQVQILPHREIRPRLSRVLSLPYAASMAATARLLTPPCRIIPGKMLPWLARSQPVAMPR